MVYAWSRAAAFTLGQRGAPIGYAAAVLHTRHLMLSIDNSPDGSSELAATSLPIIPILTNDSP